MSIEAHPNINAIGLQTAIFEALDKYVRGEANERGLQYHAAILKMTSDFVVDVSVKLDHLVEVKREHAVSSR